MKERRFFYKQLTKAEVGDAKTHEKYIRFPNDFDYEQFFLEEAKTNGTVLQIDINAQYNWDSDICIPLKFVFYANSNKEKRMPSLGPLFDEYNVRVDDIFCLEAVACGSEVKYSICFKKSDEISLLTSPICYIDKLDAEKKSYFSIITDDKPSQQIYYGAPGTGKSHEIKDCTKGESVIRTTFHPDSDYSTFVGCYKPTMSEGAGEIVQLPELKKALFDYKLDGLAYPCQRFAAKYWKSLKSLSQASIREILSDCGFTDSMANEISKGISVGQDMANQKDEHIIYEFVEQAFLQAYTKAWKFYSQASEENSPKKQYLIIEEINRGNCAQIFGDLFQLLDRNDAGFSDYCIHADKDMRRYLSKAFNGVVISDYYKNMINSMYDDGQGDVVEKVMSGEVLLLPNNLYIWATMNTSDQSLFPIDSAFKRRWNWKYMPIEYNKKNWTFKIGDAQYLWGEFLQKINPEIYTLTESSDKQMGYFFAKADPNTGVISQDVFLNKVLFYLWTDVFKDYDVSSEIFKNKKENRSFRFTDFFEDSDALGNFIENLGLKPINEKTEIEDSEEQENNDAE